ncbi:MAG: hypothetical protein V3U56_07790 [Syntrophobacteria bacterium]
MARTVRATTSQPPKAIIERGYGLRLSRTQIWCVSEISTKQARVKQSSQAMYVRTHENTGLSPVEIWFPNSL